MPVYLNRDYQPAPASEALQADGKTVRDGYRILLQPGERMGFDISLMDGAASYGAQNVFLTDEQPPASIDEAVQREIASQAKARGMKPSEYLGTLSTREIEKIASGAATSYLQAAGGAGIAKVFGMDSGATLANAAYERSVHALNDWRNPVASASTVPPSTIATADTADAAWERANAALNDWRTEEAAAPRPSWI